MKLPDCFGTSLRMLCLLPILAVSSLVEAAPVSMFDGKTFDGWEGDTTQTWRIEDGVLTAGSLEKRQEKNNFLATVKEYGNFDLTFRWKLEGTEGFINGGVQFRTQRIPNNHEVRGYQADLGAGYDGALYDESRRGMLVKPPKEVYEKLHKPLGEWNEHRVRAEGPHIQIWVNGELTADYIEKDPNIPQTGIIAIQIHGNATAVVRYKDLVIEELPDASTSAAATGFKSNDTVALIGGANLERTRFNAFLQTELLSAKEKAPQRIRNLAWEGDTVFEQWRDVNFPGILQQLAQVGATVVVAQFGQMESLQGPEKVGEFVAAYEKLLAEIAVDGRRIILLSPTPIESDSSETRDAASGNLTANVRSSFGAVATRNATVKIYVEAIRELATKRGIAFVDLFTPAASRSKDAPKLTDDGFHWNDFGHEWIAREVATQLGLPVQSEKVQPAVRAAAMEFERLWFNYWRPMNWAFLEGDRSSVAFSHDWKDTQKRIFPDEMKEFVGVLEEGAANVRRALAGVEQKPILPRSPIPVEPPSVPAETPEAELATLQVHPDYTVNLFASEADGIAKAVQIRWDERGRLWVLCIPDYPQTKPGASPRGRLVICEDTDHDGRADKFTVFADGVDMPLGFELGNGGVYLAASSELWFLRDTTGGDHANEKRLLFGGFGTGDTHQTINSLSWGFGGELWFSQGHSIFSRVETAFGIERHNRAGLWRLRPQTQQLDNFFNNSSAGANNWGVLTDDFGQVFHKEGAAKGAFYSVPGLVRGDMSLSSEAMNVLRSEKAKTVGFDLVETRHFPEQLQGSVVIGGEYDNTLQLHQFGYKDGKFVSSQKENIIETKNKAFRPVDVRMGPDGAIYFADWYNPIVGHYQASYRHPDRDTTHGRIWRVVRKDRPLVEAPLLSGKSVLDLLAQLNSPERWVRYQAKRLLFSADHAVVVKAVDAWVKTLSTERDGQLLLQALSLFEAHETVRADLLQTLLRHDDYRIRAYATRTLSNWARSGQLPQALDWLEKQVKDEQPLVRLEAVVAASYVAQPEAAAVAARVLDSTMDPYLEHALTKTLYGLKEQWLGAFEKGVFRFDKEEHLLFALKNAKIANAPEIIRTRIQQEKNGTSGRDGWLVALCELGTRDDLAMVLEQGAQSPKVLDALMSAAVKRNLSPASFKDLEPLLKINLLSPDKVVREKSVRLAGVWRIQSMGGIIEGIAKDSGVMVPIRQAARVSLAQIQGKGSVPLLREFLARAETEMERVSILEVLLLASPAEAAKEAIAQLANVDAATKVVPILNVFGARKEGVAALQKGFTEENVLAPKQARLVLNALNQTGVADKGLLEAVMKLAGFSASLPVYSKVTISEVVRNAQALGRADEGRKVFEQTGCVACHAANGVGGKIGPDLSALSRGLPPDMIVTEVLWPALNVKEGYEAASVTLKSGGLILGFKQNETKESISIRDMNSGEIQTIQHADAANVKVGGTVMPDGLTAPLSVQQVADLMRYLFDLGK